MSENKIHSAEIVNFQSIAKAEFVAEGNHIIISGKNGTGKSAICSALTAALCGKSALPDDPIRHGTESAKIRLELCDKSVVTYSITVDIKQDDFDIKVIPYGPNGALLKEIDKPVTFLKRIITKLAVNPQSFFSMKSHEQVQELYKAMPELEEQISQNKADYEVCQTTRSQALIKKKSIEDQLKDYPNMADYPDSKLDMKSLNDELIKISDHNSYQGKKKSEIELIENKIKNKKGEIEKTDSEISEDLIQVKELNEKIAKLEESIKRKRAMKVAHESSISLLNSDKEKIEEDLKSFKPLDSSEVSKKLVECSSHNERYNKKQEYMNLLQNLNSIEDVSKHCLDEMKALQAEKLNICRKSKMPIPGLAIGDDCLIYPDPRTGEMVNLNSLSTGQKWVIALALNAKLNPNCKILFIESLNDLDEDNQKLLYDYAASSGIQLVLHETLKKSSNETFNIKIKSSVEELWG